MGENKEEGIRLFSVVPKNRARGSRHKLRHGKFHLITRNYFFFLLWKQSNIATLLRGAEESPSAEIIQTQLGRRQAAYCSWLCLEQGGWTRQAQEPLSNLNDFVTLWQKSQKSLKVLPLLIAYCNYSSLQMQTEWMFALSLYKVSRSLVKSSPNTFVGSFFPSQNHIISMKIPK